MAGWIIIGLLARNFFLKPSRNLTGTWARLLSMKSFLIRAFLASVAFSGLALVIANTPLTSYAFAQSPSPAPFVYQLPGAPTPGSPERQSDYQALLTLQQTRTAQDCTRAASEVTITLATFCGPPYGPLTTAEVKQYNSQN